MHEFAGQSFRRDDLLRGFRQMLDVRRGDVVELSWVKKIKVAGWFVGMRWEGCRWSAAFRGVCLRGCDGSSRFRVIIPAGFVGAGRV